MAAVARAAAVTEAFGGAGSTRAGGGRKRIKPEEEEEEEGLEAGMAAKMKVWELQKGLPKHKADCQQQGLANGHAGMAKTHIKPMDFDGC